MDESFNLCILTKVRFVHNFCVHAVIYAFYAVVDKEHISSFFQNQVWVFIELNIVVMSHRAACLRKNVEKC